MRRLPGANETALAHNESLREDRVLNATAARHGKVRTVVQVTSGNFLEMFDFFLFGIYASYIAKAFFPSDNQFVSLMSTFLSFAAGFAMRPIGALVLGGYIDRIGRRKGLIITLSIMASGTVLIAFVPSYATIGIAAPISGRRRPAPARLFRRRRTRRRLGLSRRDGAAGPQRLLCELAIGEPTGGDHRRRADRLLHQQADGPRGSSRTGDGASPSSSAA